MDLPHESLVYDYFNIFEKYKNISRGFYWELLEKLLYGSCEDVFESERGNFCGGLEGTWKFLKFVCWLLKGVLLNLQSIEMDTLRHLFEKQRIYHLRMLGFHDKTILGTFLKIMYERWRGSKTVYHIYYGMGVLEKNLIKYKFVSERGGKSLKI